MKKLLLAGVLLVSPLAAASDYAANFAVTGAIAGVNYTRLELDITRHKRYLAVNGALETAANIGSPVTGTCQFSASGGVFCILQNGFINYILDLGPNLSGTMRASDGVANNFATVSVTFIGME